MDLCNWRVIVVLVVIIVDDSSNWTNRTMKDAYYTLDKYIHIKTSTIFQMLSII